MKKKKGRQSGSGGGGAPKGALVTAATFGSALDAQIARAKLSSYGIRAFVTDEHFSSLSPQVAAASGVRLQVHTRDLERAGEALSAVAPPEELTAADEEEQHEDGPVCPKCSGRYAYLERSTGALVVGILFLGLPFLLLGKSWHCRKCDHFWKAPRGARPALQGPYRRPRPALLARPK